MQRTLSPVLNLLGPHWLSQPIFSPSPSPPSGKDSVTVRSLISSQGPWGHGELTVQEQQASHLAPSRGLLDTCRVSELVSVAL